MNRSALIGQVEAFLEMSRLHKYLVLHGVLLVVGVLGTPFWLALVQGIEASGGFTPGSTRLLTHVTWFVLWVITVSSAYLILVAVPLTRRFPESDALILSVPVFLATVTMFAALYPFGLNSMVLCVPLAAIMMARVILDRTLSIILLVFVWIAVVLLSAGYATGVVQNAPVMHGVGAQYAQAPFLLFGSAGVWMATTGVFLLLIDIGMLRLGIAQKRTDELLQNILPHAIVERLKRDEELSPAGHMNVTVLFADIVGFTPLSQRMTPEELVALLNGIFRAFDQIAIRHGVEKIKTIGDAYMLAAGIPLSHPAPYQAIAESALDMMDAARKFHDHEGNPIRLRIGLHAGPVVAGVIGMSKFAYDVWGDTVNTAARLESHGEPERIQVTGHVHDLLREGYAMEYRGIIEVKGKGPMETWWLLGRQSAKAAATA